SGTLVNVARADAATADPDTTNNNGSAAANRVTTTVGEIADLAVAKTGPAAVNALGSITYTIVTTNNGPSPASNVAVVDTLPAGVTFVSADNGGTEAGGVVTWPPVASVSIGGALMCSAVASTSPTGSLVCVARADEST